MAFKAESGLHGSLIVSRKMLKNLVEIESLLIGMLLIVLFVGKL